MHADLHARTPRYSDFPSMKTVKNVDDKFKNKLPSTKTAENVDEKFKNGFSSMKRAKNMDDKLNISPPIHEIRRKRG